MSLIRIATLEHLYTAIRAFEGCPLKHGATQAVLGDGNPASGIVVVGEAPGSEEDASGKPFVGRSGKLLDKLMGEVGLNRGNVYITNTVFWRPPNNRPPTPAEVEACRPFVEKHLALLNPRLLILVGATAAKTVLRTKAPLGELRNVLHRVGNPYLAEPIPAIVTFHPAYLLRNPPATPTAQGDWLRISQHIKGISS
ncbi:MAG: uracil-DNA glycosylase [Alphaproteobacteria bacterium]